MRSHNRKNSQSGMAVVEFAITAAFFIMMLVAVVAGGHFFFTHNAVVEATRRGARYAANQCPDRPAFVTCANRATTIDRVKKVVLYDNPNAPDLSSPSPLVANLTASSVTVVYSTTPPFGVATGNVIVRIDTYQYSFMGFSMTMPPYQTTVQGESAGLVPVDLP